MNNYEEIAKAAEAKALAAHKAAYPEASKGEEQPVAPEKPDEKPPEKPPEETKPEEKKAEELKAAEGQGEVKKAEEPKKKEEETPKPVDWEHKYKVLQGKYNAEVPRLHKALAASQGKISDLEKRISKVEETKNTEVDKEHEKVLTTFKEEFPDIYAGVKTVVGDELKRVAKPKEEPKKEEPKEQEGISPEFIAALQSKVAEWEAINYDPLFMEWLGQKERFVKKTRMEIMREAYSEGDVDTVADLFKSFEADSKKKDPAPKKEEPKPKSEPIVHPDSGARGPVDRRGKEEEIITSKQVEQFYKDMSEGVYRGREADAAAFEKKIFKAMKEGKLVRRK